MEAPWPRFPCLQNESHPFLALSPALQDKRALCFSWTATLPHSHLPPHFPTQTLLFCQWGECMPIPRNLWRLKKSVLALAAVAQRVECQPASRKVTSSIPSQGTCLGCGPGPQLGACERQPVGVSPSLHPSLPLSLKLNK